MEDEIEFGEMEVINLPAIADYQEVIDGEVFREKGEALCPQLRSLKYLGKMLRQMGKWAFDLLLLGKPRDRTGTRWSHLLGPDRFIAQFPRRIVYLTIFCDPATGRKQTEDIDYSAIVAAGIDSRGDIFIDSVMEKTGFSETIRNMKRLIDRLPRHPDLIGFESNGMQGEFGPLAIKAFQEWGVTCDIVPVENTVAGKPFRISRLDPLIDLSCCYFVRNRDNDIVVEQLRAFPNPKVHDDGPDAMDGAIQLFARVDAARPVETRKRDLYDE